MIRVGDRDVQVGGRFLAIARVDGEKYRFLDDPESVVGGLRRCGIRIDLFTFIQRLSDRQPKYSYPLEWDNLAVLPVTTFEQWWTNRIDGKTRNMVRKAEKKGVELREVTVDDALVQGIWDLYNECPVRQGRPFPHYGKGYDTVRKEVSTFPDSSIFIGGFLGGRLIGFVKLVTDETGTQAGLMHILSAIEHRDKAPTNALIAEAVRTCAERQIPYLVYSNFSYGKKQHDSISDFKTHNGFERIDLPRYYVPLSAAGSLAFRLGLHRSFGHYLPEPVITRLRELRNAWYNRKFRFALETR